jgi:tripartite ATP-independent transporter DctM subunit
MTLITVVIFALLALSGMHLATASGIGALLAVVITKEMPLNLVAQRMFLSVDSGTFIAIPLFIFCGSLMNTSRITDRIFIFARALVGHITGGLAHANVVASLIFAGMTGASVADAGGLGQVEIKAMRDQGYDPGFAAAVTAASATIGPIIPPSVPMIVYASLAEESTGKLFLGGVIPGFIMASILIITIYIISTKRHYPKDHPASLTEIWRTFKEAFWPMMTPVVILGGIGSGVFTVTEAAAAAAFYALILGGIVYREIRLRDIPRLMIKTMGTTAVIIFILATISSVSWILVYEEVTAQLADFILSITDKPWMILLCANVFLLVLGTILEGLPIMVLTIPILLPLIESVGISPVHFGVVMVLNMQIGGITPPVGMLLFVTSQVSGIKLEVLMKAVIPFIVPLMIVLLLITFIPELVMYIPNLLIY